MKSDYVISHELLADIRKFLVDHHDVIDGPPGYEHEQSPNWAMRLTNDLDEEMGEAP